MDGLHERLSAATGGRTYRAISDLTGIHAETVRRYMQGQAPSVEFLTALCDTLEINAHWLVTGDGPMFTRDMPDHALRQADTSQLLTAVATALESLIDRVNRIETYVHTLETRLRAEQRDDRTTHSPRKSKPRSRKRQEAEGADDEPSTRARRVADAIPQRSRQDAD